MYGNQRNRSYDLHVQMWNINFETFFFITKMRLFENK